MSDEEPRGAALRASPTEQDPGVESSAAGVTTATMQRLAFVRYLSTIGVGQAGQPEPLGSVAILSFHDAVELFLHLAAEHLNVAIGPRQRPEFADYFGLINATLLPDKLSQQAAMMRLNDARIALKHRGTFPARLAVEQLRANVAEFFEANTALVFAIRFADISLVDLIQFGGTRTRLKDAQRLLESGQMWNALAEIATAFAQLLDEYEQDALDTLGRSPFVFGRQVRWDRTVFRGARRPPESSVRYSQDDQAWDRLVDAVSALQEAVRPMSLGLDYRRFAKFRLLTPVVHSMAGGNYHVVPTYRSPEEDDAAVTVEQCQFCFDFVVESAIHLQGFDFDAI